MKKGEKKNVKLIRCDGAGENRKMKSSLKKNCLGVFLSCSVVNHSITENAFYSMKERCKVHLEH